MSDNITKYRWGKHNIKQSILNQARKENDIVYGAQAIKRRLGISARPTTDYDMFSKKPKSSAVKLEKTLDKRFKSNAFYSKKGVNPGTYKVKFVGVDDKPMTKDDIGIADYTKTPSPGPKTFKFRGVKYRVLKEELKAKQKILRDKSYAYRHEKDRKDIERIRRYLKYAK